jgi:hypothetical protein
MAERRRETGKREIREEREREGEKQTRVQNKCRPGLGGCRRADRLSRFHGRSFALLTAGRERQSRTPSTSASDRSGLGAGRRDGRASERASEEKRTQVRRRESVASRRRAVTRARTRVSATVYTRLRGYSRNNVCVFPSSIAPSLSRLYIFFFLFSPY